MKQFIHKVKKELKHLKRCLQRIGKTKLIGLTALIAGGVGVVANHYGYDGILVEDRVAKALETTIFALVLLGVIKDDGVNKDEDK